MAADEIDIIETIVHSLEVEQFFAGQRFLFGTVEADEGCTRSAGGIQRRLRVKTRRGGASFIELGYEETAGKTIIRVLVEERKSYTFEFSLCASEKNDVCEIFAPDEETAPVKSYIRRYAPDLFDEDGRIRFVSFDEKSCEVADFWRRLVLYTVLRGRAREWRQNNGKGAFHFKPKRREIKKEPGFVETNRGAFLGSLFFFLLLLGWYIWLRN